jgi:hypothetical protein
MKQATILMLAVALCTLCTLCTLSACTSTREVYTQEGNIVYAISCKLQSYQGCIEEAGELCGTLGYKFVNADGSPSQPPTPPSSAPSQPLQTTARGNNFDSAPVVPATPVVTPAPASGAQSTESASQPAGYALQRKYFVRCQS